MASSLLAQMVAFLQSTAVFRDLRDSDLEFLVPEVEEVELAAGAVLFHQGDPGDSLYIVRSGTLDVVLTALDGEPHSLARLEAGDPVGEMAVLYRRRRAATVHALTAVALLKIHLSTLERLFTANPSARTQLFDAASRRLVSLYLASVPILAGLNVEMLQNLDLDTKWVRLSGGQTLFTQGDAPDYLYVVVWGRLEVIREDKDGHGELVDQLGHGAVVGEVALLSGEHRTATVRAIRDSELVRLSLPELLRLLERHPRGAIEMVRILAGRVRAVAPTHRHVSVATIAVVPSGRTPPPSGWGERLVQALSSIGGATLHVNGRQLAEELGVSALDDEASRLRVATWLRDQEDQFRYIVSECDASLSPWTELCLRQADLVLLVASADGEPSPGELEQRIFRNEAGTRSTPRELVLLHREDTLRPVGTRRWLTAMPVTRHHHVRIDRAEDYQRLARFITGKSVGLAVSGGGARTLVHVGVIRALRESGIPIDAVAGVSGGAFPVALYAMGDDPGALIALSREFGQDGLIYDATPPMVAFLSGRRMVRVVRRIFQDVDIEDLWCPFFCLSANLTTARVVVHDRGPLWLAMRSTTSVPGIAPPVCMNGELLVDGGVLNNLPADVMRSRGVGTVIASDVSLAVDLTTSEREMVAVSGWPLLWARLNPFAKPRSLPHIFDILTRTATLSSIDHARSAARHADLYVWTPTADVSMFDWNAGMLVERGYRQAIGDIEKWKTAAGSHPWVIS